MAARKAFLLRINPALWEEINRWAGEELRSVNGQIEFLLKRAVEERRRTRRGDEDDNENETGTETGSGGSGGSGGPAERER